MPGVRHVPRALREGELMVCPDCGMSTWKAGFGCLLPICANYGVLTTAEPEANDDNNLRTWREETDKDAHGNPTSDED